jgi:hypothetical protein
MAVYAQASPLLHLVLPCMQLLCSLSSSCAWSAIKAAGDIWVVVPGGGAGGGGGHAHRRPHPLLLRVPHLRGGRRQDGRCNPT